MIEESIREQIKSHCDSVHGPLTERVLDKVDRRIDTCKVDLNMKIDTLSKQVNTLTEKVEAQIEKENDKLDSIVEAWNNAKGALYFVRFIIFILGIVASVYIFIKSNFIIGFK